MNTSLKIFNICTIFIISFVLFISFAWIGYKFEGTQSPLKEAVTSTFSFLAILATLTATYVASKLFNDWREQHNKVVRNEFSLETYKKFSEFDQSITLCAFDVDTLQDCITDVEYHITADTPVYTACLPNIQKLFDSLHLVRLTFTNYLHAQRAYGAVTGQVDKIKENLELYISEYSDIKKHNLNNFDNVQELINKVGKELNQYSELSLKIYDSNIKEILKNLQVDDQIT